MEAQTPDPASAPQALETPRSRERGVVAAFMFGHFTHHVTNTLLTPLLPVIRNSFGLTYTQSGFLVSAYSVSQGFSQAPIGALADRIGSRTVVVGGLFGTALFCFLIGLAGEYWHLLAFLIGLGIIAGTYHAPAASLLAQVFHAERRGGVLGLHVVGGNLSFFATPLVAGGLVALTGTWRTPYLYFGLAPLIAAFFLAVTLPRAPNRASGLAESAGMFRELASVARVVGPLLALAIAFQMLYAAALAFLALYLVDARGFEPALAAVLVSVPYIGGLAGSPVGGSLSDRVGRKPVISFSLACLGPLLLAVTTAPSVLLVPLLLLMGFASSMRMPVIEGLLLDRAPVERRATTLGAYYFLAQELGGVVAPVLGAVAGVTGIAQAYSWVGLAAAILSLSVLALHRKL